MNRLTLGIVAALLLSLGGNAFFFWQWAQAKPECVAKRATDSLDGAVAVIEAKAASDQKSAAVTRESDQKTAAAVAADERSAEETKKDIHDAYRAPSPEAVPVGDCVVLRAVPVGVQTAIDKAVERSNRAR